MRLSVALISYFLTVLFTLVLPIFALIVSNKKSKWFRTAHFLLGALFFVICLIGYFLILSRHLSTADNITDYYNTVFYRVTVVSLLSVLVAVILWLIGMLGYAKRLSFNKAFSFFTGFGSVACILVGVYCLIMFFTLCGYSIFKTLSHFDTTLYGFYFITGPAQHTTISVFTPIWSHVTFGVACLSFFALSICIAAYLKKVTTQKIKLSTNIFCFIGIVISFVILLDVVVFMMQFSLPHYIMAGITVICVGIALGMIFLASRKQEKPLAEYNKQFDYE